MIFPLKYISIVKHVSLTAKAVDIEKFRKNLVEELLIIEKNYSNFLDNIKKNLAKDSDSYGQGIKRIDSFSSQISQIENWSSTGQGLLLQYVNDLKTTIRNFVGHKNNIVKKASSNFVDKVKIKVLFDHLTKAENIINNTIVQHHYIISNAHNNMQLISYIVDSVGKNYKSIQEKRKKIVLDINNQGKNDTNLHYSGILSDVDQNIHYNIDHMANYIINDANGMTSMSNTLYNINEKLEFIKKTIDKPMEQIINNANKNQQAITELIGKFNQYANKCNKLTPTAKNKKLVNSIAIVSTILSDIQTQYSKIIEFLKQSQITLKSMLGIYLSLSATNSIEGFKIQTEKLKQNNTRTFKTFSNSIHEFIKLFNQYQHSDNNVPERSRETDKPAVPALKPVETNRPAVDQVKPANSSQDTLKEYIEAIISEIKQKASNLNNKINDINSNHEQPIGYLVKMYKAFIEDIDKNCPKISTKKQADRFKTNMLKHIKKIEAEIENYTFTEEEIAKMKQDLRIVRDQHSICMKNKHRARVKELRRLGIKWFAMVENMIETQSSKKSIRSNIKSMQELIKIAIDKLAKLDKKQNINNLAQEEPKKILFDVKKYKKKSPLLYIFMFLLMIILAYLMILLLGKKKSKEE